MGIWLRFQKLRIDQPSLLLHNCPRGLYHFRHKWDLWKRFCIDGSVDSWRGRRTCQSNDKTKIPFFSKKMFPKKLFEGWRRRQKGKFSESSLWNTWRTQNELEGRKEEEEVEVLVGEGGDNHFYIVIQCMEEGWRGRDHCSSAPSILWEHFDRQSNMLKGTLLLAGSEEAVYRRACLIWSPIALLYGKDLSFDVSLFLQFPSYSCFLPKRMLSVIVCLTHIHLNLRRQCGDKTTETVSNWCTVLI